MTGTYDLVPVVELVGAGKTYRSADGARRDVLVDVDLAVRPGDTVSIVGASGSGKSTLLGILAGFLCPDTGTVRVGGVDRERAPNLHAEDVGVVLQRGNLIPFLTAQENIELAVRLAGRRPDPAAIARLLKDLGVAGRSGHRPARLSGGEAQRVALAAALVNKPPLLIADEVTGQLDESTAQHVIGWMLSVAASSGAAVVFSTHSSAVALKAQRRFTIEDSRLVPA